MNEQWEALTDEQREAVRDAAQKIAEFVDSLVSAVVEAVSSIKEFLDGLLPNEYEWAIRKKLPPRKIGTPHDGFVNMRLCRPPKLC